MFLLVEPYFLNYLEKKMLINSKTGKPGTVTGTKTKCPWVVIEIRMKSQVLLTKF